MATAGAAGGSGADSPAGVKDAPDTRGLQKLAEDLHACVSIQDRAFRLFRYRACFVAREAVDWIVESRRAPGRAEAVQLGRLLQASGYVHHVVDDHDFKDEFLYFRFYCDEPERQPFGEYPGVVPLRSLVAGASSSRGGRSTALPANSLSLGSPEARALLASASGAKQLDTNSIGSPMADRLTGGRSPPLSPRTVFSASSIASTSASAGPRAAPVGTVAGLRAVLMPLAVRLRARLDTRDRVFHLRTYRNSFVGSQCVDLLVRWGLVPSRVMAVALGRQLLAARFIHHVCDDHDFRDGELFYRFFADEDDEDAATRFFASPILDLPTLARPSPVVPRLARAPRARGTDRPSWRIPSHVACNSPITGLAVSDALQWAIGTADPLATAWCLGVMRRRARFLALSRPGARRTIAGAAATRFAALPPAARRAEAGTPEYLWQPFPDGNPWEEIRAGDGGARCRVWRLSGDRVHQLYRAEAVVDASLGDARLCIASLANRGVWDTACEEPKVIGKVDVDRRALEAATWEQPGSGGDPRADALAGSAAGSVSTGSSGHGTSRFAGSDRQARQRSGSAAGSVGSDNSSTGAGGRAAGGHAAAGAASAYLPGSTASSSSLAGSDADGLGPLVSLPVPRRAGRSTTSPGSAGRGASSQQAVKEQRKTAVGETARLVRLIGAAEVLRILEGARVGRDTTGVDASAVRRLSSATESSGNSSGSAGAATSSWGYNDGPSDHTVLASLLGGGGGIQTAEGATHTPSAAAAAALDAAARGEGLSGSGQWPSDTPEVRRSKLDSLSSARRRSFPRIVHRRMRPLAIFVAPRDAVTIQDAHAGAILLGEDGRALAGPPHGTISPPGACGSAAPRAVSTATDGAGSTAQAPPSAATGASSALGQPPCLPAASTPFFTHFEVSVQHSEQRGPSPAKAVRAEIVLECWSFFDVSTGAVGPEGEKPRTLVVLTSCLFPGPLPIWLSNTLLDAQAAGPVERLAGALRMLSNARRPSRAVSPSSVPGTEGGPMSVAGGGPSSLPWANPFMASSPGTGGVDVRAAVGSEAGSLKSTADPAASAAAATAAGKRAAAAVLARYAEAEAATSSESDLGSDSGSDAGRGRRKGARSGAGAGDDDADDSDEGARGGDRDSGSAASGGVVEFGRGGKRMSRAAKSLLADRAIRDVTGTSAASPAVAHRAALSDTRSAAGGVASHSVSRQSSRASQSAAAGAASSLPSAPAPRPPRLSDFDVLAVLGRGGYGKVMQVRHRPSGAVFAMKVLRKSSLVKRGQVARTLTERDILASATHPFVVGLRCAMQTSRKLYLCMDFVPGGDFFTLLSRRGAVAERRARVYVAELVLALAYLHSRGVVYRDLKPENVLLDAEGHVKLADFGLSRLPVRRSLSALPLGVAKGLGSEREPPAPSDPSVDDEDSASAAALVAGLSPGQVVRSVGPTEQSFSFCGTEQYMAPEVLLQSGHTATCDWWSLGIFVSELLTGQHPFRGDSHYNTLRNMVHPAVQPMTLGLVSAEAASLLGGLLTREPKHRLGSPESGGALAITRHPWFSGLDWHAVFRREVLPGYRPPTASPADTSLFDSEFTRESPIDSVASSVGDGLAYEQRRLRAPMEDDVGGGDALGGTEPLVRGASPTPGGGDGGSPSHSADGTPLWYFPRWEVALPS